MPNIALTFYRNLELYRLLRIKNSIKTEYSAE